jgi:hypothetical protein
VRTALTSRLARLEAQSAARRAYTFFYGWLKPLPATYTGERRSDRHFESLNSGY